MLSTVPAVNRFTRTTRALAATLGVASLAALIGGPVAGAAPATPPSAAKLRAPLTKAAGIRGSPRRSSQSHTVLSRKLNKTATAKGISTAFAR